MKCDETRVRLAEYAGGGLSYGRRFLVARHLTACASCRAELAALERTGALLARLPLASAPEGTWEAIRRSLEQAERVRPLRAARRLAMAAALAVLVLFAGVLSRIPTSRESATTVRVVKMDRDIQSAEEGHLSATWEAPLSDAAAMGLRLEATEDDS